MLSVASLRKWRVVKADAKSAFLQTGPAGRDVSVVPPRESKMKNELWLLLAAVYSLVNANANWQVKSDDTFKSLGLTPLHEIQQLFVKRDIRNNVCLIAIKIVEDI